MHRLLSCLRDACLEFRQNSTLKNSSNPTENERPPLSYLGAQGRRLCSTMLLKTNKIGTSCGLLKCVRFARFPIWNRTSGKAGPLIALNRIGRQTNPTGKLKTTARI